MFPACFRRVSEWYSVGWAPTWHAPARRSATTHPFHTPTAAGPLTRALITLLRRATAATAQYDKEGIFEKLGAEGSIGVQVHGGGGWPNGATCRWKNVKVRPL